MLVGLIISLVGALSMAGVILFAAVKGDFYEEGSVIVSMPWGVVSLVDLYSGFALIIVWMFYREDSWIMAALWSFLTLTMGNLAVSVYVFVNLLRADRDIRWFFMGQHAARSNKD